MSRRQLQIALGCLWILDGLFQLQPKMFSSSFARGVILPVAIGQPAFVSDPIHWAASLFILQPILSNVLIVITQLAIGLLILSKRTVKIGLLLSIFWGLFIWGIGEAYGGIFSGQFSLLMGAPGAALIYAVLSFAAFPSQDKITPSPRLAYAWCVIWSLGALLLIFHQNSASNIHTMLIANSQNAPHWLSSVDTRAAGFISGANSTSAFTQKMSLMSLQSSASSSYWVALLLGALEMFIAIGIFMKAPLKYVSLVFGSLIMLLYWIIGQSAAGYYSGLMTDLNSAPLIILMGFAITRTNISDLMSPLMTRIKQTLV